MKRHQTIILGCLLAVILPSAQSRAGKILLPQLTDTDGVAKLTGNAYFYCPAVNRSDDVAVSNVTQNSAFNTLWQSKSNWIKPRSGSWSKSSGDGSRIIWGKGNDSMITSWKGTSGSKLTNIYAECETTYVSVTDPLTTKMKVVWDAYSRCP